MAKNPSRILKESLRNLENDKESLENALEICEMGKNPLGILKESLEHSTKRKQQLNINWNERNNSE